MYLNAKSYGCENIIVKNIGEKKSKINKMLLA